MQCTRWKQFLTFAAMSCGIAFFWTAAAPVAYSQAGSAGVVSVTVTDPAGAAVPAAGLELKDLDTNVLQKGTTQANGAFTFASVTFGRYQLTVAKTGFESQIFDNVQVQTGRTTDIKAVLKIGTTQQTVTVQGESPLVETDTSVLSDTIDTKQVVNLPLQAATCSLWRSWFPGGLPPDPDRVVAPWTTCPAARSAARISMERRRSATASAVADLRTGPRWCSRALKM